MYKEDLALNNVQGLICHKTKPNKTHLMRGGKKQRKKREKKESKGKDASEEI